MFHENSVTRRKWPKILCLEEKHEDNSILRTYISKTFMKARLGGNGRSKQISRTVAPAKVARLLPLVPLPCRTREREREGSRSSRSTRRRSGLRWLGQPGTRGGGGGGGSAEERGVKERESERERKMGRAGQIVYDPVTPACLESLA